MFTPAKELQTFETVEADSDSEKGSGVDENILDEQHEPQEKHFTVSKRIPTPPSSVVVEEQIHPRPTTTDNTGGLVVLFATGIILAFLLGVLVGMTMYCRTSSPSNHNTSCGVVYEIESSVVPAKPTSSIVDITTPNDRRLIRDVLHDLTLHLLRDEGGTYECLCMHHLKMGKITPRRICAVKSRIGMINPKITGSSSFGDVSVTEHSIFCDNPRKNILRARSVTLAWFDPHTGESHRGNFYGTTAMCLQLALDEMDGNLTCK